MGKPVDIKNTVAVQDAVTLVQIASGTAQGKVTSTIREGLERVWKPNTTYVIALTPGAASMIWTVDCSIEETTYTTYPT